MFSKIINRLIPDVPISIQHYSEVPANKVSLQKMETIKPQVGNKVVIIYREF